MLEWLKPSQQLWFYILLGSRQIQVDFGLRSSAGSRIPAQKTKDDVNPPLGTLDAKDSMANTVSSASVPPSTFQLPSI